MKVREIILEEIIQPSTQPGTMSTVLGFISQTSH
jgi:hypothetical protein